jgi:hypothetical protein
MWNTFGDSQEIALLITVGYKFMGARLDKPSTLWKARRSPFSLGTETKSWNVKARHFVIAALYVSERQCAHQGLRVE